jgi:multiple sugar transport system permease protein
MVVVSVLWGYMLHPNQGIINGLLQALGLPEQNFLTDQDQALASLALLSIWKDVGLSMIFYLAGLLAIPRDYYDAARVDGSGTWHLFRHITLPLLRSTHVFVFINTSIAAFKVFTPVKLLTEGGPSDATNVIVHTIFELAFVFNRFSYAAALSVLLLLLLTLFSVLSLRLARDL